MKQVRMNIKGGRMKENTITVRTCPSFILYPSSLRHRGFSFTEVLFAVIILGIGFIMIAAIFPVALMQSPTRWVRRPTAAPPRAAAPTRRPWLPPFEICRRTGGRAPSGMAAAGVGANCYSRFAAVA